MLGLETEVPKNKKEEKLHFLEEERNFESSEKYAPSIFFKVISVRRTYSRLILLNLSSL